MTKRMLIDAAHPEETRVVVVDGTRLEELDFEIASRKPIKGNIYLAKVTRVEPSLQAAFVEYGGNRHGFLAFNEIHPDYFRIPVGDREALDADHGRASGPAPADADEADAHADEDAGNGHSGDEGAELPAEAVADAAAERSSDQRAAEAEARAEEAGVEQVGGDEVDEARRSRPRPIRSYKIQEVIKRRQIMLVQVTKEERGNKGAALTTFLSLPGRYCVLMPNTPRGGGVSRKITNAADRKRLKEILDDLDLPDGMSVILRTAGMERSKQEIKRDLDYLLKLWDGIREKTLESTAPALIYEEGNLIKKSIRDIYGREIDEVLVEGDEGYRGAKDLMRMLMPSHAKKVQQYKDELVPLFARFQVESQIDAIHDPVVQLKSGGYIVLNQTEALVSIDVNSGRATKERHIEETATKTNLEAADEIARQLRLRDLAGLVVIDFIDMEESRNNAAVERRLKEAMKADRARIQIGRISPFGLLELSRQRLRPSLVETHFARCPHCQGQGLVRTVESASMQVMRAIQEEGTKKRSAEISVTVPTAVALHLLNQLRPALAELERRYAFRVLVTADDGLVAPAYKLDRLRAKTPEEIAALGQAHGAAAAERARAAAAEAEAEDAADEAAEEAAEAEAGRAETAENGDEAQRRKRRRRRRRRRGEPGAERGGQPGETFAVLSGGDDDEGPEDEGEAVDDDAEERGDERDGAGDEPAAAGGPPRDGDAGRRRRRGKRGGRRRRREGGEGGFETAEPDTDAVPQAAEADEPETVVSPPVRIPPFRPLPVPAEAAAPDDLLDLRDLDQPAPAAAAEAPAAAEPAPEPAAKPKRAPRRRKAEAAEAPPDAAAPEAALEAAEPAAKPKRAPRRKAAPAAEAPVETAEAPAKPKREPRRRKAEAAPQAEPAAAGTGDAPPAAAGDAVAEPSASPAQDADRPPEKPRRGWWNRLTGG
jgi:ribonuclease E